MYVCMYQHSHSMYVCMYQHSHSMYVCMYQHSHSMYVCIRMGVVMGVVYKLGRVMWVW